MLNISLCMIVKNEQQNLMRCLESVRSIVSEIIVVDTGSTDKTKEIASLFGAQVIDYTWNDDFSAARNVAIEGALGEWVLVLDADEYVVNVNTSMLQAFFLNNKLSQIGTIEIQSRFLQGDIENTAVHHISRLFPAGISYTGRIHEQLNTNLPRVSTGIVLKHEGYYETNKAERNLRLLHKALEADPGDNYYLFQIARQYRGCSQSERALNYIEKCYSTLNGQEAYAAEAGIEYLYILMENRRLQEAVSVIQKQHTFLENMADYYLVCGLIYTKIGMDQIVDAISYVPLIEQCYLKCLSLGKKGGREIVKGTATFIAAYNLGAFYEAKGDIIRAKYNYRRSAEYGYDPATNRLKELEKL
ncbi:glycosyltransferase family 2 protein [Paenibacillus anaericanus]|uniref:Glycosyltransferase family 2 protein n=1 Tax=Paenibacillus anaericanus TaxID=170367 RepID=A0A3S1DQ65_9BACL|nr:glycosyltransferase family 2 protein [Paenibacillus anaericanus]RUT42993.1 glycosyltransferase family 2 protein [Paenibacillus anaericanus]